MSLPHPKGGQEEMTKSQYPLIAAGAILAALLLGVVTLAAASPAVPIGRWPPVTSLPEARTGLGVVTHGNWLYAIGGRNSAGKAVASVWRAHSADDGSVSWMDAQPLPVPLYLHAATVSGGYVYVIGGYDDTNYRREVWRAQILADGSLAGWQPDRDYPYQITLYSAVAHGGRLYVVGGVALINNQTVALNKVFYANIGAGGTLGPWQEVTSLPRSLYRTAVTAAGAKLYVSGGYDDSADHCQSWRLRPVEVSRWENIPEPQQLSDLECLAALAAAGAAELTRSLSLKGCQGMK